MSEFENPSSDAQIVQENEYEFPYHYLAQFDGTKVKDFRRWSWSTRYFAGLRLVIEKLPTGSDWTLADIGCGDGRLLHELSKRNYYKEKLFGHDYYEPALYFARAFNPDINFSSGNLADFAKGMEPFDVVTLVEVLEHVELYERADFICAVSDLLRPGGKLLLTVPHANKPLSEKHIEHFSAESLEKILSSHFSIKEIIFFDSKSRLLRWSERLLSVCENYVTFPIFQSYLSRLYFRHFWRVKRERDCLRMFVSAEKK